MGFLHNFIKRFYNATKEFSEGVVTKECQASAVTLSDFV